MILLLAVFLFFTANAQGPSIEKKTIKILSPESDTIIIDSGQIIRGSFFVKKNGILLENDLWRVEGDQPAIIRFIAVRTEPETLSITYRVSSFKLGKEKWRRRLEYLPETADSAVIRGSLEENVRTIEEGAGLTVGGSKTLGVTVGSGGALAVNQTLDLSVFGEIMPGTEIRARLADRNLPFRSEGSTESIREIDKVLIEIRSRRTALTVGDMNFTEKESRFASYDRKIKGVLGEFNGRNYKMEAGAALSEGRFHSYSFSGIEGRQGPYILADVEGRQSPLILSATERVYVNGRIKQRGEGNDYTMDYTSGRLTFTPRCLITGDDRITVEFEYLGTEYQKNLFAGKGNASFRDGKVGISFSAFQEGDNPDQSAYGSLSKGELDALGSVGDSAVSGNGARLITADSTPFLRGFYVYDIALPFPDSHFIYHIPKDTSLFGNRSLYHVSFVYKGNGNGNYVSDSVSDSTDPGQSGTYSVIRRIYRYVGEGLGDYVPGRRLSAPQVHDIGQIGYSYSDSIIKFNGEVSLSKLDGNVLSSIDDADNEGFAIYNNIRIRKGVFELTLRQEERSGTFRSVSTIDDAYLFGRKWNQPSSIMFDPYLSLVEGVINAEPKNGVRLKIGGGMLKRSGFSSFRGEAGSEYMGVDGSNIVIGGEGVKTLLVDTARNLVRATIGAGRSFGKINPHLGFSGEFTSKDIGKISMERTFSIEGRLGAKKNATGILTGETELSGRIDKRTAEDNIESWKDSTLSATWINRGYIDFGRHFRSDVALTHRESRRNEHGVVNSVTSDLVSLQGSSEALAGFIDQRFSYMLSTEQSELLVPLYIAVPSGTGTHIRDSLTGDYIAREGGNYIYGGQAADTNASLQDALKSMISYRLTIMPKRLEVLENDTGFLQYLSVSSYLNAEQDAVESNDIPVTRRYFPDLRPTRAAESGALRYFLEARQEIAIDNTRRQHMLRLRIVPRYRFNRIRNGEIDQSNTFSYALSFRHKPLPEVQFEHSLEQENVSRISGRTSATYDVLNRKAASNCEIQGPYGTIFPVLVAGGLSRTSLAEIGSVPFYKAEVGVVFSREERGRMDLRYIFSNVLADSGKNPPYDAAEGEKAGKTHKVNVVTRLNATRNVNFDLSLFWERNSREAKSLVRGNMELRAFF